MPAVAMFVLLALAQQAPCQQGQVVEVKHGRDYTLNVCGVGVIALRGVEPPLKVATGSFNFGPPERPNRIPTSGEVLGQKDIGPEAIAFLTRLLAGHRVTLVNDGYRMGDPGGRQYAYAFLPDKTHINAELIRRGYAYADLQGSHPRRDEFVALEEIARRSKVGLWAPNP
jgi:endonuclease YncB( thermonuclease family)